MLEGTCPIHWLRKKFFWDGTKNLFALPSMGFLNRPVLSSKITDPNLQRRKCLHIAREFTWKRSLADGTDCVFGSDGSYSQQNMGPTYFYPFLRFDCNCGKLPSVLLLLYSSVLSIKSHSCTVASASAHKIPLTVLQFFPYPSQCL